MNWSSRRPAVSVFLAGYPSVIVSLSLGDSLHFFFFVAGCEALSPFTLPSTLTCEGSMRVGAGEDETNLSLFFHFLQVG